MVNLILVQVLRKVVGGGRGWLGVVDTRYRVSQPGADADRYRCAWLTQGLAGRGDGYQCGLDWGRSSSLQLSTSE